MTNQYNGILRALVAAIILAVLSTLGDFLWAHHGIKHRMFAGILHGALLCLCLGVVLGYGGKTLQTILLGALGGLAVGILSAGGYYFLRPFIRFAAMIVAWMELWILAALLHRWVGAISENLKLTLLRGILAAATSGLAFYAISGIWTKHSPGGPNYLYNLLCWTIAFLPGFLALFVTRKTD
ncbi:MAG: hypothetical protein J4F29_20975 [Candidatus Latescibacteria bacterium]|nr:hypothetical protein [Candidatus Latescibacterota bacterium]